MQRAMWWVVSVLVLGLSACDGGGDGNPQDPDDECRIGAETCACTDGGACDAGLTCASGLCVALSGDGDGGDGDGDGDGDGGDGDGDGDGGDGDGDGDGDGGDGDGDGDGDGGGGDGDGDGDGDVVFMTLANTSIPCAGTAGSTWPILPAEAGHVAATRLDPGGPFVVTTVRYRTAGPLGNPQCAGGLAHTVDIFVGSGTQPPAQPSATMVQSVNQPQQANVQTSRVYTVELNPPVTLAPGESIFIGVHMAASSGYSLCLEHCDEGSAQTGVDFWSNSATEGAGYPWDDMVADFGFPNNFMMEADGYVP